jgi:hypothetical protein
MNFMGLWFQLVDSFLQFDDTLLTVHKKRHLTSLLGGESEVGDTAILPGHLDSDATTSTDA